ncbi:MAG TPA: amino acid adenylation domain-containing protein, partial [Reyranella sp.]|nr:amino acid adenylation domain-containing protein [Reyranella sp.]
RRALEVDFPLSRLFETPTPAGIAEWATHHRRQDSDIGAPMSLGLTRAPSSFAQRRLWLMDRLGTTGAAYLMPVNLRLRGPLDQKALQRALEAIVHRHAALRTLLVEEDGEPWQHIMPCGPFPLATIDLAGLSSDARSAELERLLQESAHRPFDLARDLPFRAELVRLREDEHVLLAAFHHAASDGWSINVFFGELGKLYTAFAGGEANPLPPLPIQYADFAIWQRDRLTGPALERELAYWRPLLTDLVPLALPTDRPRAMVERFRGSGFRFTVSQAVTSALRDLAQREGATLYMTVLAAYMALLHRYTGEQRIAVGSPVANRNHDSVEGLLGFFVNSLVMTADIDGSERFVDLLAAVRKTALGAFDHQDVPFEKLVEELRPVRDLSRNPLFQVVFALQQPEAMAARLELSDLAIEPLDAGEITVRFDLEMHVWLDDGKLQGLCTFDRDLFEETTIRDLVRRYGLLLEAVTADPATPIDRIGLLDAEERRRLHALAMQPRPTFAEACLHSLVVRQAALSPDRVAITAPDRFLSYGELDRRSNQLARYLVEQGLPRGGLVAVMLQRSSDLPLAMLAILKAGGAYVPLDPRYPTGRLAYILEDTKAAFVLVDEASRPRLPTGAARIIACDGDGATWKALPDTPIVDRSTPSDPAYVIYTSGSSGNPKGVTVSHANATRLFSATADLFHFDADDVWSCFHSAAFDFSVWEIWGALIHGGRLVMVGHDVIRSPQDFAALLVREGVTVLNQTPSAFAQLSEVLTGLSEAQALALRWVIFGGEALDVSMLRDWFHRFGDQRPRLVNCYGITETTVHVTYRLLDRSDLGSPVTSPIGQPIADLSLHLLDANLEPVPDNVPAEICVAGPGVAQGYLHVPDLTAARFVEHPFAGGPGRRLYRSGDLARRRPSGEIEYLGRLDSQIKLRGHRIEPGEIAARLREHALISDAAVVLRKGPNDDPRLCAYIVPANAAATTGDRAALEARQTANWQTIFDEQLGRDGDPADDPLFKLTGWLSAYDRKPIPADQMRAWADGTVEQILSFDPGHVLEIGCGTGILLFGIAPHCKSYHGIDLSEATLAHVRAQVEANAPRFDSVTLEQRTADQLDGLAGRTFDTIVVNSVVQYLPSFGHVVRMIEAALRLLSPGGTIFLGDIRDHRLLLPLHASIQLSAAESGVPASEILSRARQQAGLENELLLAPDFFRALQSRLPQIGAVGFLSQRGATPNELNKFRYAAVLKKEPAPAPVDDEPDFEGSSLDSEAIEGLLAEGRTGFTVKGLANALLADDLLRWRNLEAGDAVTAGDLQALQASSGGTMPETLHRQAARHGYHVVVAPTPDHVGHIDARFARTSTKPSPIWTDALPAADDQALALLASDPLRLQTLVGAWPDLRRHLEARLPEYMVPSEYVVLDRLPLTINGKLDTRNLPAPDRRGQERTAPTRPPSTPTEVELAAIFRDLLGLDEIGVDDDFFLLGGHSLLATSLCSRIRLTMAVEVPLLRVFQTPTIAGLADAIEASRWATAGRPQDSEMATAGEVGEI